MTVFIWSHYYFVMHFVWLFLLCVCYDLCFLYMYVYSRSNRILLFSIYHRTMMFLWCKVRPSVILLLFRQGAIAMLLAMPRLKIIQMGLYSINWGMICYLGKHCVIAVLARWAVCLILDTLKIRTDFIQDLN